MISVQRGKPVLGYTQFAILIFYQKARDSQITLTPAVYWDRDSIHTDPSGRFHSPK